MPDETYNLEIRDNLNDLAIRAKNAQRAVDDLERSLEKSSNVRTSANATGEEYSNLLKQIYESGGAKSAQEYAKQAGLNYDAWAKSMGYAAQEQGNVNREIQRGSEGIARLGGMFERQLVHIGVGIAVWSTLRTAQQEIQKTVQAMEDYSIGVARFAAVTEQSVGSAVQQYNALRDAATQRGFTPTEAAPAIITSSRFTKAPEAQQQLMEAGARLAEFMGAKDPSKVIEKLGEAVIATGGDFSTAAAKAEMLASAFMRSGSSAEQFLDTLSDSAAISEKLGMSYDKTVSVIVSGATASGQTAGVSFQALTRISETFDKMGGEKLSKVVNGFRELGVNVLDSGGKLKSVGSIIEEVGQKFSSWDVSKQQQAISLLFGGETVKGNIRAAGKGLVEAFSQGLVDGFSGAEGVINSGLAKIEDSFGGTVKRVKAQAEAMRQEGNIFGAFSAELNVGVESFIGSLFGGAAGGKRGAMSAEFDMLQRQVGGKQASDQLKKRFIESLAGLTREEAASAVEQYNRDMKIILGQYIFFDPELVKSYRVSDADMQNVPTAATKRGLPDIGGFVGNAITQALKKATPRQAATAPTELPQLTPIEEMRSQLRNSQDIGQTAREFFPSNALDLTKYSMQEINQIKQTSLMLAQQELEAIRAQATALGLTTTEIDKIVEARRKELEMTTILVNTQQGLKYEMGMGASRMSEATSTIQKPSSSFAFQRVDVGPEQFGQLAALTAMYNAMLTKLGSPEKEQNVNVLLEGGQLKVMNTRMTALQLALEDLTKVEKAQLSGTWNLPAGATALVPISSLDLQRWNKSGSGMPDLSALLGATNRSGELVSNSQQVAASRIVDAIHSVFSRMGLPTKDIDKSQSVTEAVAAARNVLRGEDKQTIGEFYDKWAKGDNPMVYKFTDYMTGLFANSQRDLVHTRTQQMPITSQLLKGMTAPQNINISALPVKAALTANVSVVVNGQIIARAIMPLMYDWLTKLTASTGYRTKGTQR